MFVWMLQSKLLTWTGTWLPRFQWRLGIVIGHATWKMKLLGVVSACVCARQSVQSHSMALQSRASSWHHAMLQQFADCSSLSISVVGEKFRS